MTRPGGTPFSDQTQYDWNIATVPQSERADALNGAFESIASSKVSARGQPGFRSQVTFMYSWKDGRSASIFTAANLATMCSVESVLLDSPRYNEFCLLPANASAAGCASPTSLVSFQVYAAAGALVQWKTCALLPEATVAAFAAEVVGAIVADASSTTARAKGWMMASDVAARNVSVRARSLLNYGAPLDGFTSEQDRITEQRTQNNKYFNEVKESLFAKLSMLPPGANPNRFVWSFVDRNYYYMRPAFIDDLQVEFWSFWFQNVEFSSLVDSDLTITIVSIIYVIAYMSMHMQSVYLGVVGMIQIMLSLPVSYFIYSCIFQVAFFQQIHILVIFVVLGVGADDIFVLVDAYKQTEGRFKVGDVHEGQRLASREDVLKSRMAEAYERAMKAIFNTSFTTACAFLANVISPVMPISSFGIYAALCIVLNYIIVITWTPAALVIYHKWCECLPFCGCCFCWQLCGICPPVRGQVPDAPCWTAAPDAAAAGVAVEMTTTTTTTSASDAAVVGAREAERGGDNDSIACDGTEDVDIVVLDAPASGGTLEDASEAEVATDDETESDAPLGWRAKFEALLPPSQYSFGTVEWVFDVIYIPLMLGPVVTVPGWCCDSRNAIRSKCIAPEAEEGADNAVIAVEKKKVDGATSTKVEGHRVQLKLFSIFTIILLSIYAIIAATMTFKLTTPEQEEEWFADGHMFNGLRDRRTKNFFSATNTENTKVYLSWGIAGIDRTAGQESGVAFSRWKPGLNRGSVEWDTSFSVSSVAAQQHVLETCTKLEAAPCTAVGCSLGKLVVPGSVVCPLAVLKTWLEVSALRPGQCDPINAGGVCFTSQAAVYSTPGTVLPSTDTTMSAAFTEFIRLNPNHPVAREKLAGVINGVLKFLVLAPYSTMPLLASQDKLTSVYAEFETFVDARRVGAPAGLLRLEHSTWAWGWMRTQQGLVDGLFNGLGITFPVAFLGALFERRERERRGGRGRESVVCCTVCGDVGGTPYPRSRSPRCCPPVCSSPLCDGQHSHQLLWNRFDWRDRFLRPRLGAVRYGVGSWCRRVHRGSDCCRIRRRLCRAPRAHVPRS